MTLLRYLKVSTTGILPPSVQVSILSNVSSEQSALLRDQGGRQSIGKTKKLLKEESVNIWQGRWENSDKGRATYEYIPNIRDRKKDSIPLNTYLTQFLTGHGKFAAYMNKIQLSETSLCPCGVATETSEHALYECSLRLEARTALISSVSSGSRQWPLDKVTLMGKDCRKQFNAFCNKAIIH